MSAQKLTATPNFRREEDRLFSQYAKFVCAHRTPCHRRVQAFFDRHKSNRAFARRARALNRIYMAFKNDKASWC